MRSRRAVVATAALVVAIPACRLSDPPTRPEQTCIRACEERAHPPCDSARCRDGCAFILDRIIEREGGKVVTCMSKKKQCDDASWAECAVRVGEHADGGPPAPPPRPSFDESDDKL